MWVTPGVGPAAQSAETPIQPPPLKKCRKEYDRNRQKKRTADERADREAAKPPQQVAEEQRRANLTAEQRIAENRERKRERDRVQKAKKHHPERSA